MTELLSAISVATEAAGYHVELAFDAFPRHSDDCVYVVVPHEFHAWGDASGFPNALQRSRTIALCTENPGTSWFEATYRLLPQFAAAVSINRSSAAELRRRGLRCEHVQLGYVPSWDTWLGAESVRRDVDVLYLGAADPRRDPLLAGLGRDLSERDCQLLVPPLEPRMRPRPDFLSGVEKYHRLRSSQILVNLHRTTSSALEWMRFLEAICNGCVVVSEPCLDSDPLLPDEHFVAAPVEQIGAALNLLLDEPDRLQDVRDRAYDFVRRELPIAPAGERLAELAADLRAQPTINGSPAAPAQAAPAIQASPAPLSAQPPPARQALAGTARQPPAVAVGVPSSASRRPHGVARSLSKRLLRRDSRPRIIDASPAFGTDRPRVSVVSVATHHPTRQATDALRSAAASRNCELELLMLAPPERVSELRSFLRAQPRLPAALLQQSAGDGLGYSLNRLVEHARGEYLFVLAAGGGIYPTTLRRLVTALDRDPLALFSYSMVGLFDQGQPVELLSSLPWEPERLKSGNWIDPMALIRRNGLLELGCFSADTRLAGWEAFDLWCKCAEAGGHGVHVPQVLAWHRRESDSDRSPARDEARQWELMRERFPRLLSLPSIG